MMELSLQLQVPCFCLTHLTRHGSPSRPYHHLLLPLASSNIHHPPSDDEPSGDPALQQKLVDIFRLQAGKIRVSDLVDERSKHLTDIAGQAMLEYDRIAEDAKKGIDEAGAKAIQSVEEDMQAFEEQLASARAEIEARDEELDEFEKKVQIARSEGLFFKELYKPSKRGKGRGPEEQKIIRDQVKDITNVTKKTLASKSRQNLYVFLISLLSLFVVEGFRSPEISWPRLAIYGAIIVILILQLAYERFISSNRDDAEKR